MLESIFVALIVVAAAAYAVWALMPVSTRRNLALKGAQALGGPGAPGVAGKAAGVLQRVAKAPGGGCSDCPAATLTPAERTQKPHDSSR
jgi:hypothetical protein